MDQRYKDIQDRYLAELRQILPSVLQWWEKSGVPAAEGVRTTSQILTFEQRWPAGPAAHPRVIHIFRKYFLEISELNDELEDDRYAIDEVDGEDAWGIDEEDIAIPFEKPIDLLVNDLSVSAPDLFEVMQGMVFIPVGMDPAEEFS
jgi:hypothetical protein